MGKWKEEDTHLYSKVFEKYVTHQKAFILPSDAKVFMDSLVKELTFEQHTIMIYGEEKKEPRLSYFATEDPSKSYAYSGRSVEKKPFTPTLTQLKKLVEERSKCTYDACLVNYYRDGKDNIGWHSDREQYHVPVIASLSLGATRDFVVRKIKSEGESDTIRR